MRVFKSKWFSHFAEKEAVSNDDLKALVEELEEGYVYANLGSGVYKQRPTDFGEGRSGSYRVIVYYKKGNRTFFQYCFTKFYS